MAEKRDNRTDPARFDRPTILVLIDYYLPGCKSGGPLRAVSGLTDLLGDDHYFRIITSDRDRGDRKSYQGIQRNRWIRVGKADVMYVDRRNPFALIRHILKTPNDVLYVKSFFSRPFSMLPIILRALGILRTECVVVAPAGEFSLGALGLKKLRKRLYIAIARNLRVYKRAIWHATTEYEAADVQREIGAAVEMVTAASLIRADQMVKPNDVGIRVLVASELPDIKTTWSRDGVRTPKAPGKLLVVFLSRISRKKNLDGALNFLRGLRGHVSFDIYGPIEDRQYWNECQRIMAELPSSIRVQYRGCIPHHDVNRTLASYHLFFFPTKGENFGYVIMEALLAGCPILISDQTPWKNLQTLGIGWDLPLNQPECFREALQRCIEMGPEEHSDFSARAVAYGLSHLNDSDVAARNRSLFRTALAKTGS